MIARTLVTCLLLTALAPACSPPDGSAAGQLFRVRCGRCHTLDTPLGKRKDLEGWRRTVWVMRQRGAELTEDEAERIAKYLAQVRGP